MGPRRRLSSSLLLLFNLKVIRSGPTGRRRLGALVTEDFVLGYFRFPPSGMISRNADRGSA